MDDPVADLSRSILDGHIVLSRKIAQRNHFPAIDVLASASRVMGSVISEEHKDWSARVKEWMALYRQVEDLLNLGAYQRGANPKVDTAIAVHDRIDALLRQKIEERGDLDATLAQLRSIIRSAE